MCVVLGDKFGGAWWCLSLTSHVLSASQFAETWDSLLHIAKHTTGDIWGWFRPAVDFGDTSDNQTWQLEIHWKLPLQKDNHL